MKNKINKLYISISIVALIAITLNTNAQEIKNIDSYFEIESPSFKSSTIETQNLRSLYYDFNNSIIVKNQSTKTIGNGTPIVAYVSLSEIEDLKISDTNFKSVEMIIISSNNIEDHNEILTNKHLSNFPSLNFLVFSCTSDCTNEDIEMKLDSSIDKELQIFYSDIIPE